MKTGWLAVSLSLLAAVPLAAETPEPGECATCHPAARVQWQSGVHAREGMVCGDCHGGDSSALEADPGHLEMRWFEEPAEIVAVCGGCHAEVARMRPYNLAVDQQVLYEQSVHGRARLAGDEQAPVCVDCHRNHRVLRAIDPASPVFNANLPRTCGSCHADLDLTEEREIDACVVDGFNGSPHGRALVRHSQTPGPSCASCHDGHGAAVPLNAHVDEICGGCHEQIRARLRSGSHAKLLRRQDLAGCASCHRVHAGLEASPPNAICIDCHEAGSDQVALGVDIEQLLREAKEEVAAAELALFKAHRVPLNMRDHEALVSDAREYLRRAGAELHSFQREPIEELARASRSVAFKVHEEINQRVERKSARTLLYFTWFYAAVTLGVLGRFRWRALHRSSR